ncbi:MAG: 50S ribosomal protein L21, partial [Ensifer adhaerens]
RGHRQHQTTVRILDIAAAGGKAKKASKKSEAAAEAAN